METQSGDVILGFYVYFDIRHNWHVRFVSSTWQQHLTHKNISWYSLLLEADWISGLLNVKRIIQLEIQRGTSSRPTLPLFQSTRWLKYDRDKLWLVYTQIVPVIFELPKLRVYSNSVITSMHTSFLLRFSNQHVFLIYYLLYSSHTRLLICSM